VRAAAREIQSWGARNVVIKGGHREGPAAVDVLFDGRKFREYAVPRIDTRRTHGTGCTFASAIAAFLALQDPVEEAVQHAKDYLTEAMIHAEPIGHGHGPVSHFWMWEEQGAASQEPGRREERASG